MNKLFSRLVLVFALVAIMASGFAFAAPAAKASDGTFHISVYHGINGKALGLSKELPVIAAVYKDGVNIANLPLEFKDRFTANLPEGTYTIMVTAVGVGPVPSMTVGPVFLPEGAEVRLQAQLSAGGTPILSARVK